MGSQTLTLREFEHAWISSQWEPARNSLTAREVALLDQHQRRTRRVLFNIGYKSVQATNWVGVIGLGNRCIEVVPKLNENESTLGRENLAYMIWRSGLVPLSSADVARLVSGQEPILSAYLSLFVEGLLREWRRGQIRQYVSMEDNRPSLKGRLVLPVHLRKNLLHRERFYTVTDEFTADNRMSQLLKAALGRCERQRFSENVAGCASRLIQDFEDVSDVSRAEVLLDVQTDRNTRRFESLVNMAKFIVRDLCPMAGDGGDSVYSLMFDMNVVFERFIAVEIREALRGVPLRVRVQLSGRSLLTKNGQRQFRLRPDLGIFDGRINRCLIDTKWKRLDLSRPHANVAQSDVYQMYAYGKEYNAPRVVVLYPRFGNLPEKVAEYEHNEEAPSRKIEICTINISEPLSQANARGKLLDELRTLATD